MAMSGAGVAGGLGLAILAIFTLNITVPLIKDAVGGASNLTAIETTIAGFVSLFAIAGLLVSAGVTYGLI